MKRSRFISIILCLSLLVSLLPLSSITFALETEMTPPVEATPTPAEATPTPVEATPTPVEATPPSQDSEVVQEAIPEPETKTVDAYDERTPAESESETITSAYDLMPVNDSEFIDLGIDPDSMNNRLLGDYDNNDKITAAEARIALRVSAKLETGLSADQLFILDANHDGLVLAADARVILRMSARLEKLIRIEIWKTAEDDEIEGRLYTRGFSPEDIVTEEDGVMQYVRNEILLVAKENTSFDDIEGIAKSVGGEIVGCIEITGDYQIAFANKTESELKELIDTLKTNPYIDDAMLNFVTEVSEAAVSVSDGWGDDDWSEANPSGKNWGLEAIKAREAWEYADEMSDIRIGVIDSGFDTNHEDLHGIISWCPNNQLNDNSHGSHVLGTFAALTNNGPGTDKGGISGVFPNGMINNETPKASAFCIDADAKVTTFDIKEQLAELLVRHVKVINVSMNWDDVAWTFAASVGNDIAINTMKKATDPIGDFLYKMYIKGYDFVICQAAGNISATNWSNAEFKFIMDDSAPYGWKRDTNNLNLVDAFFGKVDSKYSYWFSAIDNHPEIIDRIIVVGAIENQVFMGKHKKYAVCSFSNWGDRLDILAPGKNIYSTEIGGYGIMDGTSQATPHVSGVAAMVWAANTALTGADVKKIICNKTSVEITDSGKDFDLSLSGVVKNEKKYQSNGLLDAQAAVEEAIKLRDPAYIPGFDKQIGSIVTKVVDSFDEQPITDKDGNNIADLPVTAYLIENGTVSDSYSACSSSEINGDVYLRASYGNYELRTECKGYEPDTIRTVCKSGDVEYAEWLKLKKIYDTSLSETIKSTVHDGATLAPVSDVSLSIKNIDTGETFDVSTNGQGDASCKLPLGEYLVTVSKMGYNSWKAKLRVDKGQYSVIRLDDNKELRDLTRVDMDVESPFKILLGKHKLGTVNGFVVDNTTNNPIIDVNVILTNNSLNKEYNVKTDGTGAFNCTVPYGSYSVEFNKDGYEQHSISITIEKDSVKSIDTVLLKPIKNTTGDFLYGDGTEENPYHVATPEQLNAVRNNLTAHYIQTADIDLKTYFNWDPIGTMESPFNGSYDGNGNTISNLNIKASVEGNRQTDSLGLFSYSKNCIFKRMKLNDFNIFYLAGHDYEHDTVYIGTLVGYSQDDQFNEIDIGEGTIKISNRAGATKGYIGGVVGYVYNSSIITNCINSCRFDIQSNCDGWVSDYYAGFICGGILGGSISIQQSRIYNCKNKGIFAPTELKYTHITYSGITSDFSGENIDNSINNCSNDGTISLNNKLNGYMWISGISHSADSIQNCINNANISLNEVEAYDIHIEGIGQATTIQNCINNGNIIIDNIYDYTFSSSLEIGGITLNSWVVESCTNNGDISAEVCPGRNNNLIGGISARYSNSEIISNCKNNGVINVVIKDRSGYYYGSVNSVFVGGIVAEYVSGIIEYCVNYKDIIVKKLTDLEDSISVAGGIVGKSYAENSSLKIMKCANYGNIHSIENAGGIVGDSIVIESNRGELQISNCFNVGNISTEGAYSNRTMVNSYRTITSGIICGEISSIENCYSFGIISTSSKNDGNKIADIYVNTRAYGIQTNVQNCYTSKAFKNENKTDNDADGIRYLRNDEMNKKEAYVGFDFNEIWQIGDPGFSYPSLSNLP